METDIVADLVTQALVAARVVASAEDPDDPDGLPEYVALLWRAAADGAAALPLGLELIGSADPIEREAGCTLLGDTSNQNEAVRAETATALVALAQRETEDRVLWALARAIEMTYDPRAVPVLVTLAGHPDAEVREQVARSFPGVMTGLPDGPDIRVLVGLTQDPEPEVRNWATFTLGTQAEVDSPAIRAALWERTTDEHTETRAEAIHGLARRRDRRAGPFLAEVLDNPEVSDVFRFGAVPITGAVELLPAHPEYEPGDDWFTDAVNAFDPARRARLDAFAWELVSTLHQLRPDLDAALSMERFGWGRSLGVDAAFGSPGYDIEALLARADGDPTRAAELVATDLPRTLPDSGRG
ncbi:HEAT repeat domain-containing protein [Kitasatospora sp. NBC_01287]|uniref:HEAT repeat domain-containing protein n=1 Tax=Kitasatospora sp. NBC_01287 TaxID=2903573 RepID=UPI0022522CB0|nr:HEAT repeat domain-containing protein [Kitasatospora sp. NBC_01287]MCX4746192.1 HEAT repeat domain-containing protein [Kitasatospora sp. NBC_01287]